MAASTLTDLIEWNNPANKIYEPLLTCHLTNNELIDLVSNKMNVPDFPVHGQSIERCVQAVTRASATVYGAESRDGFIKATIMHRRLMGKNESKKDLLCLFD